MSPSPGTRPRLVPPELADRLPALGIARATAVAVGALSAVAVVVQAVALATIVDRSLLHHAPLGAVRPELVVVAAVVAGRAAIVLAGEMSAQRSADSLVAGLRSQLVRHVLALGPSWLADERPGELSLTATRGLRALHTYFARYLPQAAAAVIVPVLLLAWVATQDWLSLVVVVALVVAVPISMVYFGREATRRTARQWRRLASLSARFLQLIEGLPTLRAFGREAQGRREVSESAEGVRVATVRTLRVAFLSALSMDLIAGFGVGFVAMALGLRLLWGALSLRTALAVLLVAPEIFVPLRRAGAEFHASTEGQAAALRVLQILDVPAAGAHRLRPIPTAPPAPMTRAPLQASHVRVQYPNRSVPALDNFSLSLPDGARVALVGPSGSGKSTVFAALLALVPRNAGALSIDGRDSGDFPLPEWRSHFSWVPQRPYLFTASLADNVRLGAPDAAADGLEAVLGAVGLDELVAHLPLGLDTPLGQDGFTLSVGERQRVALARALVRPAPVLLLDEPTASLDPNAIAAIGAAIEPWLAGRTVVVAAHGPTLLSHFDQVVEVAVPLHTAAVP